MSNTTTPSKNSEPTISDVFALLCNLPTKSDLDKLTHQISESKDEQNRKIEEVEQKLQAVETKSSSNNDKILMLENTLHILQQERLKNNVCITGIQLNENLNAEQAVIEIGNYLNVQILPNTFTVRNTSASHFIIVMFNQFSIKQQLINKMRVKKTLMTEEVFNNIISNSQIFINDHLTKHFNDIYVAARRAKKNGNLASVSSIGGRIRVRKNQNDTPIQIFNHDQLELLINATVESNQASSSNQTAVGRTDERSTTRAKANTTNNNNQSKRKRPNNLVVEESEGRSKKQKSNKQKTK